MKNRGKSRIMKNYKNVIASTKWLKRVILNYTKLDNLLSKLSYALWVGTKWSLFDHLATCCLSGHDPRMGRRIFVGVLFATLCFFLPPVMTVPAVPDWTR